MVDRLPPGEVGRAVLDERGFPFRGSAGDLDGALTGGTIRFHAGAIRGAVPTVRGT